MKSGRPMNPRRLGLILVVAAFIILFTNADSHSPLLLYAFLALLVPGALLAAGIIGTPARIAGLRSRRMANDDRIAGGHILRDAATPPNQPAQGDVLPTPPRMPVVETRVFRYPRLSPTVVGLFIVLTALMLVLAAATTYAIRHAPRDAALVTLPLWAMGAFLPLYFHRHRTAHVQIDPDGITVRGYFRTQRLRWDDVIALHAFGVRLLGTGPVGGVFNVYGRDAKLSFNASIGDVEGLAEGIAGAVGMAWR